MDKHYDYLIVGAGIYGATFACMAHRNIEGINVHKVPIILRVVSIAQRFG